jgi:hypothetical protein
LAPPVLKLTTIVHHFSHNILLTFLPSFSFLFFFRFFFFLLCWVGVHYGIYKSSYNTSNTSYLNSPPPPFSFILPSPQSRNSFNRYHFSIYRHVDSEFASYSPSHTLSPLLLLPLVPTPPPDKSCSALLFSDFV